MAGQIDHRGGSEEVKLAITADTGKVMTFL